MGLPNIDAWEHTKLLFIENNPKYIQEIVNSRKINDTVKGYPLLDIGRGSLILYNEFTGTNKTS